MLTRPSTFSIVAHDPKLDAIGIAVQSKFISVGSIVPYASADAGAVATQSFTNVAYGPNGLDLLREGNTAAETIDVLTAADENAPQRQIGIIGQDGSVAGFTGEKCSEYAGDIQGDGYTVQGNTLENRETLESMAEAYEETSGGLPERLITALYAGNEAGGDKRGEQSASLYIVKPEGGLGGRNDRWVDVRVDDHESPIAELERVFKIYDITLLEREEPETTRELNGELAEAVLTTLADLDLYEGTPGQVFDQEGRMALKKFRGMNNFENHSIPVLEDALVRGWNNAKGTREDRIVDAIWHGLSHLERK